MALETKPFRNLPQLPNGTSVANNIKLTDCLPFQHTDINEGVNSFNKITMGQMLCEPVATAGDISGNTYSATCSNFPDFAISYTDEQQKSHYYIGMKVRVVFNNGITYGSVSGGTYPKLNINNSGAIPLLAQGKTMASGACSSGQSLEFTLIPYDNGVAWDADSNVRESTSDYTIYTDGSSKYTTKVTPKIINNTNYPANQSKTIELSIGKGLIVMTGQPLGNSIGLYIFLNWGNSEIIHSTLVNNRYCTYTIDNDNKYVTFKFYAINYLKIIEF